MAYGPIRTFLSQSIFLIIRMYVGFYESTVCTCYAFILYEKLNYSGPYFVFAFLIYYLAYVLSSLILSYIRRYFRDSPHYSTFFACFFLVFTHVPILSMHDSHRILALMVYGGASLAESDFSINIIFAKAYPRATSDKLIWLSEATYLLGTYIGLSLYSFWIRVDPRGYFMRISRLVDVMAMAILGFGFFIMKQRFPQFSELEYDRAKYSTHSPREHLALLVSTAKSSLKPFMPVLFLNSLSFRYHCLSIISLFNANLFYSIMVFIPIGFVGFAIIQRIPEDYQHAFLYTSTLIFSLMKYSQSVLVSNMSSMFDSISWYTILFAVCNFLGCVSAQMHYSLIYILMRKALLSRRSSEKVFESEDILGATFSANYGLGSFCGVFLYAVFNHSAVSGVYLAISVGSLGIMGWFIIQKHQLEMNERGV